MRIWLINSSEAVPTDPGDVRLRRTGILADVLTSRGHDVVWWAASFHHILKVHRFPADTSVTLRERYRLRFLHGPGYRRNVSLQRLWDHRVVARKFRDQSRKEEPPDLILCSFPTLELSAAAVAYGREKGVPVVLDIRDLWPDLFLELLLPKAVRPLGYLLCMPLFLMGRSACRHATAITGVTEPFVDWGLRRGGRKRSPLDRCFHFGYVRTELPEDKIRAAEAAWDQRGVSAGSNDFNVVFFGTIGRQFDFQPILKAARLLQEAGKNIRFVLCGMGDLIEQFRTQNAGVKNLLFPGWVGAPEIKTLMRRSAIGLAPYQDTPNYSLNIPNKPAEYFSEGLPVALGLGHGVLRDLLDEHKCGFSYHGSAEELVRVLCHLQDDREELNRMSGNARALFERTFVAEKVYGDMTNYLEEVIAATRATA